MKGLGIPKVAVLFCLLYPALSSAFFFGLELTNPAGGLIGALNPTQTGLLGTAAAAGAGLGALGLAAALRPRPQTTVVYTNSGRGRYNGKRYYRRRGYYRGKRQVAAQQELTDYSEITAEIEATLGVISKNKLERCFQRMFCDIAARPSKFERDLPIVSGVRLAEEMADDLSENAIAVSEQLMEAFDIGTSLKDADSCQLLFSDCQWTSEEMDASIKQTAEAATAAVYQQG